MVPVPVVLNCVMFILYYMYTGLVGVFFSQKWLMIARNPSIPDMALTLKEFGHP